MKKILVCGILLGLLTTVSFAQRRALSTGGTIPGARLPNATSTHIGMNPNSLGLPHGGVLPSATAGKASKTTTPNSTNNPRATTVKPNSETIQPDNVKLPDARTGPGPDQ
jgi:hypothetical protein